MADPAPDSSLPRRGYFAGRGFVERITLVPRAEAPRFAAMVAVNRENARDSSPGRQGSPGSHIRLVWIGQRKISGVDPGITLSFEGTVSMVDGTPTVHNPRYEIIDRPEEFE